MESARKIWSFARCGDGRLMNEQLEALQKKITENTPLPLQLKLNLQLQTSSSSKMRHNATYANKNYSATRAYIEYVGK
ncbi:hypothetical protein ZWY2020_037678 [Hordeum vulgare]|nr:hypothetical protein ZWY2020_037678 [Hordeum vulgare]